VERIDGKVDAFVIETREKHGSRRDYRGKKIIIATGYYDRPNPLGIPGEDLPARFALFHRCAPVLESGCGGDRRKKFGCRSCARPISRRRGASHWFIDSRKWARL